MPDTYFTHHGATFVWDDEKERSNLRKHGIEFKRAVETFFDPFMRIVEAGRNDEARDKVIGYDESSRLLAVVNIVLESEAIRIISAWPATTAERQLYDS